jgi:hypothetical protein
MSEISILRSFLKECLPVMQQEKLESRRLWRHVTVALFRGNIEVATRGWLFGSLFGFEGIK